MEFDAAALLSLLLKMAVTGGFVVIASYAAERGGPLIGAMVATLPISAGPAYVFLALEHTAEFIGESALSSFVANAATAVFALTYAALAQRAGTAVSLSAALCVWVAAWLASRGIAWTLPRAILQAAVVFPICLVLASRFSNAPLRAPARRWFDLPLRAGLVAVLVSTVVSVSAYAGTAITGALAVAPVVLTSLILILQPRVGGRATGAVISNAISGLVGFAISLAALHVAAVPLGVWAAFALALSISIAWNVMVFTARRHGTPI